MRVVGLVSWKACFRSAGLHSHPPIHLLPPFVTLQPAGRQPHQQQRRRGRQRLGGVCAAGAAGGGGTRQVRSGVKRVVGVVQEGKSVLPSAARLCLSIWLPALHSTHCRGVWTADSRSQPLPPVAAAGGSAARMRRSTRCCACQSTTSGGAATSPLEPALVGWLALWLQQAASAALLFGSRTRPCEWCLACSRLPPCLPTLFKTSPAPSAAKYCAHSCDCR